MVIETDPDFEALLLYLKEQRGFDFTGYKRPSLMRRVRRRMDDVQVESFTDYREFLELHPSEFTALFNTILINVTSFFRDTDAWSYLRDTALPDILRRREGRPVRVWSAGCATGQEAYSLAMLLAETLGLDDFRERVKIYATDVDEEALTLARQASYTDREARSVPPELLERYFEQTGPRFVVRKELRRAVIFGRNDLVQDAPISHVDVLTCRNTLMYFNAETQSQIVNRIHFALRPEGLLFLGKAELLLSHSALFDPVDLRRRFFRRSKVEMRTRRTNSFPFDGTMADSHSSAIERVRDEALLSSAVPQIVVDTEGKLVVSNNRASQLFGLDSRDIGRPVQDLEVSYQPVEIRGHIAEAWRERRAVWVKDVVWNRTPSEPITFDVQVVPLSDETGVLLGASVIYNDVTSFKQLQGELEYANRQLETAYEEVQSTNEELETTNEELQSTVEELETTNEELQSTNEELETMNEELQSMNDELQMSNEGLRDRQDEVDRLNHFMSEVLASLRTGIIVVDGDVRVLAWNHLTEDLWGVRSDEAIGRHLSNLDIGLPVDQFVAVLRRQLAGSETQPTTVRLSAVNRRGREVLVDVTIMRLAMPPSHVNGAIIVTDVVSQANGDGSRSADRSS